MSAGHHSKRRHADRGVIFAITDLGGDGVEIIEQEVRFNLAWKGAELGLRKLLVHWAFWLFLVKGDFWIR